MKIQKGQRVQIKKERQDAGDDSFAWTAVSEVEKGRMDICPNIPGLAIQPIQTVGVEMIDVPVNAAQKLGRRGGKSKSPAKAEAARWNY